jgi:hypothetical protein
MLDLSISTEESNGRRSQHAFKPNAAATGCWIIGLLATYLTLSADSPERLAAHAAIGVGLTLLVATGFELTQGVRSIFRPDIIAFVALYFLTFFEFLLPQPLVNQMTTTAAMYHACWLALLAFGSIAVARHFAPPLPAFLVDVVRRPTAGSTLLLVFALCLFIGVLYMLLAVNFNVFEMIDQMMGPRFTQPWSRGRFGDWKSLLNQLADIIDLVPPLGGLILARRQRYHWSAIILVVAGVLFCLFQAVASGTRNVLATYLITFLVAYALSVPRKRRLELAGLGVAAIIGFFLSSSIMLKTRTIGLKEYLSNSAQTNLTAPSIALPDDNNSFFVDLNLVNVSELTTVFPKAHNFLGFEVPYIAAVAPIPRALWPGKPIGLSVSLEDALGAGDEMTLSTTFIGEGYMAGGALGVVIAGCFFGIFTGWWSRLAPFIVSELGFLIYASGFVGIAISMRSLYVLTTAALPTLASILIAFIISRATTTRPQPFSINLNSEQTP